MLYTHVTHVVPHDVSNLCNRQLLPQLGNIDLQREVVRINEVDGLVEASTEIPLIRPNHHEFDDEYSKMQAKREIREHVSNEGRCNIHCLHKRNTREPYYPSEGNTQKHNSKASKMLDRLPISLGQAQYD